MILMDFDGHVNWSGDVAIDFGVFLEVRCRVPRC